MDKKTLRLAVSALLPAGDAVFIMFAVVSAYYARFFLPIMPVKYGVPDIRAYLAAAPVVTLVFLLCMNYAGLYLHDVARARIDSFFMVMASAVAGTVVLLAFTFFIRQFTFSRVVMLFTLALTIGYIYAWRLIYRQVFDSFARNGVLIRKILVLGATQVSGMLMERLFRDPSAGYRVAGCLDNKLKYGKIFGGVKILGKIKDAENIIKEKGVDEVFIGMDRYNREEVAEIIMKCEGVRFMIASDMLGLMAKSIDYNEIFGIPVFTVKELPLDRAYNRFAKRALDIAAAGAGILILSPLLLALAALVKISSPGPVFYAQERVGRGNKNFMMYKFRSMRKDAEEKTGPKWARENDPRRTQVGAFMRKTSLDELPQLFNIFAGDMSLVGPRPERPNFVREFSRTIPRYLERHRVKSGLTGWAQVNGLRGNTSLEERVNYDIYYIENWSLWLDIKILIKTALEVFHHDTAY